MKRLLFLVSALALCATSVLAQSAKKDEKVDFKRNWYLQVQAGAGYTLGEVSFGKLVSPAAALNVGHQFSPVMGMRFGLSAWQSKGSWVAPETVYNYNYVQGNVDVTVDLANLFGRFNAFRTVNPYAFVGVGVNGAFGNDKANELVAAGHNLQYIWKDSKVFVAGRMGLGVNFRLSDCVLLGIEANANMLSDKYNSKKAGNLDWQFNALAGLTFRFGKNYKKHAAPVVPATPVAPAKVEEPAPAKPVEQPKTVEPVTEVVKPAEMRENVFFQINSAVIRTSEESKIASLVDFLKANPSAKVSVTGYADADTGNATINKTLSQKRADNVAAALKKAGIAADRIVVDYKGDTEKPFATAAQNRVAICIAQ